MYSDYSSLSRGEASEETLPPVQRLPGGALRVPLWLPRCRRCNLQQGLLHDLGEGWVDVERVVGQLVNRLPEAHGIDERLQQESGVRPDDVRPQDLPCVG